VANERRQTMAGYGMIRVATWNVWERFGRWEERWPAIVEELRALDPDVIALQETWREEERTQARLLADELGYPHWAHEDVEQVGGIAIVSRLPLMAKRRLDLQYSGHGEWPGTALIAGVEAGFGTFDVACVVEYGTIFRVLGSSASPAGRLLAYRVIVDELTARDRDIPPVLLGDLNATPYDEDMRVLTGKVPDAGVGLVFSDAWEMLNGPEGGWTFDMRDNPWLQGTPPGGRYRIDHVLPGVSPDYLRSWRVDDSGRFGLEAHNGVVASDHYGIFADLELTDPF
jgi:endonuclease/exonuclease/phosphatase family metal-dependent hydrolase